MVPYEEDEVTRIIQDDVNESIYKEIQNWTISELREWILDNNTTGEQIKRIGAWHKRSCSSDSKAYVKYGPRF